MGRLSGRRFIGLGEYSTNTMGCVLDVVRGVLALGGSLGWAHSQGNVVKAEKVEGVISPIFWNPFRLFKYWHPD